MPQNDFNTDGIEETPESATPASTDGYDYWFPVLINGVWFLIRLHWDGPILLPAPVPPIGPFPGFPITPYHDPPIRPARRIQD